MKFKASIFAFFLAFCILNVKAQVVDFENFQDEIEPTIIIESEIDLDDDLDDNFLRIRIEAETSHAFFAPSHLFRPLPRRAVIYSAIFPGLGQAYNRQYWKIPIVFGGFVGLTYAFSWNQGHLTDLQGAFVDLRSGNPEATRWHAFVPHGQTPDEFLEQRGREWFAGVLENRRDQHRHWRDLTVILTVGLYLLAMVDAYVDARLFDFTMSQDLSMRVVPTTLSVNNNSLTSNILNSAYGIQWSFRF